MSAAPSVLSAIAIVLVRPETAANVGAVARVIRNFGLGPLRIIGEPLHKEAEAERLAHRSLDVLRKAEAFPDLTSALAGAQWAIGTSRRMRREGPSSTPVRTAASRIVRLAEGGSGALVFGPESDGLSRADLARCDEVVRIPQRRDSPALNLAQAAAIVGSELFTAALAPAALPPTTAAGREGRERVVRRMTRLARHCGLAVRNRPEELAQTLGPMFGSGSYSSHELAAFELWLGQIEWFVGLSQNVPERGGLRE